MLPDKTCGEMVQRGKACGRCFYWPGKGPRCLKLLAWCYAALYFKVLNEKQHQSEDRYAPRIDSPRCFFGRYIQIRFPLLEKTLRFAQKEAIARRSNLRCKDQRIISCLLYAKVTGSLSKLLKREHFSGKTGEFPP